MSAIASVAAPAPTTPSTTTTTTTRTTTTTTSTTTCTTDGPPTSVSTARTGPEACTRKTHAAAAKPTPALTQAPSHAAAPPPPPSFLALSLSRLLRLRPLSLPIPLLPASSSHPHPHPQQLLDRDTMAPPNADPTAEPQAATSGEGVTAPGAESASTTSTAPTTTTPTTTTTTTAAIETETETEPETETGADAVRGAKFATGVPAVDAVLRSPELRDVRDAAVALLRALLALVSLVLSMALRHVEKRHGAAVTAVPWLRRVAFGAADFGIVVLAKMRRFSGPGAQSFIVPASRMIIETLPDSARRAVRQACDSQSGGDNDTSK